MSHWDENAFWYPSRDRRGLLLLVTVTLFLLHFGELLGIHTSRYLVGGAIPLVYAYHLGLGVLYVIFAYILYREWPDIDIDEIVDEHKGGGE